MSKALKSQKKRGQKTIKQFKSFFGSGLRTESLKCPYCTEIFESIRDWGLHIKEEHCR